MRMRALLITTVSASTGTGFASPATVSFGGAASTKLTVASSTRITAAVPAAAVTGKITVSDPGGSATSTATFTVAPGISLSRTSGPSPRSASPAVDGSVLVGDDGGTLTRYTLDPDNDPAIARPDAARLIPTIRTSQG